MLFFVFAASREKKRGESALFTKRQGLTRWEVAYVYCRSQQSPRKKLTLARMNIPKQR